MIIIHAAKDSTSAYWMCVSVCVCVCVCVCGRYNNNSLKLLSQRYRHYSYGIKVSPYLYKKWFLSYHSKHTLINGDFHRRGFSRAFLRFMACSLVILVVGLWDSSSVYTKINRICRWLLCRWKRLVTMIRISRSLWNSRHSIPGFCRAIYTAMFPYTMIMAINHTLSSHEHRDISALAM